MCDVRGPITRRLEAANRCAFFAYGIDASIDVASSVGRQVSPATDRETAPSILWFATTQCIESKQDRAGLAPKDCSIPAKPVERVVGQIGQTQKATCEVGGGINGF